MNIREKVGIKEKKKSMSTTGQVYSRTKLSGRALALEVRTVILLQTMGPL